MAIDTEGGMGFDYAEGRGDGICDFAMFVFGWVDVDVGGRAGGGDYALTCCGKLGIGPYSGRVYARLRFR